jgi:hypothetical protein
MAEKVTLAEAKALGFNSTKGITKEGGMYKFDTSLAPDRSGFQSVGVAAPGQVQMTPYYGDVTGAYRLTQEQFGGAYRVLVLKIVMNQLRIMRQNEIKGLVDSGMSVADATAQIDGTSKAGGADGASGSAGVGGASLEAQGAARSAYALLLSEFSRYGLESLVSPLQDLIKQGLSGAEFQIALRNTDAYQKRFAGNTDRIKKGLVALSPGEYLALEDQYQNIMRNYGLPASYYTKDSIGTQAGFNKLIANDVSAVELEERVLTAQKRVLDAAPEVMTALKQFYPNINNSNILAYTLDPEKGLEDIRKKVTAAEIGGAALGAGLTTSLTDAEYLRRYGVTKETAQRGYEIIGGGLERGRQLADIYQQPDYTQAVAEEEVFNLPGQTESQQKRKKIIGLEKAEFGGQSGMTSGALSRDRAGSY